MRIQVKIINAGLAWVKREDSMALCPILPNRAVIIWMNLVVT